MDLSNSINRKAFVETFQNYMDELEISNELKKSSIDKMNSFLDAEDFKNTGKSLNELLSEYENGEISSLDEIFKISDKEVQPMYDASKDRLTVDQEQIQQQEALVQDNSSLLENSHMDTEYIVNGVAMNIDEEWLQFFQDAQERGEDLEEAYENYKKEQEVEEIETKKTEERKEDKAQDEQQQEDIVVEDDGTVKIQAEEETELSAETIEVEGNEFFDLTDIDTLKKSKKAKKVAVVEKDEGGNLTNVQIFKPVEFFRQSEVTTHEFEETISELTALTRDRNASEKENSEEEISQD